MSFDWVQSATDTTTEVESFMAHTSKWATAETQRDKALSEVSRLRAERDALAMCLLTLRSTP